MPTLASIVPRLPASNLARTIAFYRDVLGFAVDVAWPSAAPTFVILRRDQVSIGFFEPNQHQPGPPGYAELYIGTADILALYGVLQGRVPIEWGPEVYSYGRREFAVRDTDGYLVIFTEPTDEAPTSTEPESG